MFGNKSGSDGGGGIYGGGKEEGLSFFLFVATAPSRPWPPRSRGF